MTYIGDKSTLNLGNLKASSNYAFNASQNEILIRDEDYIRPVLAINLVTDDILYNPLIGLGGTVLDRELIVDFDTSAMNDTDRLLVIYEYSDIIPNQTLATLNEILRELRQNNLYLQMIVSE